MVCNTYSRNMSRKSAFTFFIFMSEKGLLLFFFLVKMTKMWFFLTNSLPHVIILNVYLRLLLYDTAQISDSLIYIYIFVFSK